MSYETDYNTHICVYFYSIAPFYEVIKVSGNQRWYASRTLDGKLSEWKYDIATSDSVPRQMYQLTYYNGDLKSLQNMAGATDEQKKSNKFVTPITKMNTGNYWGELVRLKEFVDQDNVSGKFATLDYLNFPKEIVMGQFLFIEISKTSTNRFMAKIFCTTSSQVFVGLWGSNSVFVTWKDLTPTRERYIKEMVQYVRRIEDKINEKSLNLLTITDTHTQLVDELGQTGNTVLNYQHIKDYYSISEMLDEKFVDWNFHLGDWTHGRSSLESTYAEVVKVTREFYKNPKAKGIHGNHDYNGVFDNDPAYSKTPQNVENIFPKSEMARFFTEPSGAEKGKTYYDFVDEKKKVHYIFLDTFDFSYLHDASGQTYRRVLNAQGIGGEQIKWLVETLNHSEYDIVLCMHCPLNSVFQSWENYYNGDTVREIIEAFQAKKNLTYQQSGIETDNPEISYYQTDGTVDFSSKNNRILTAISGHRHMDESIFLNGVRYVSLLSAVPDAGTTISKPARPYFTVEDNAISFLSIDKENNIISLLRYGAGQDYSYSLIG